jgi:hypothetical protein
MNFMLDLMEATKRRRKERDEKRIPLMIWDYQ